MILTGPPKIDVDSWKRRDSDGDDEFAPFLQHCAERPVNARFMPSCVEANNNNASDQEHNSEHQTADQNIYSQTTIAEFGASPVNNNNNNESLNYEHNNNNNDDDDSNNNNKILINEQQEQDTDNVVQTDPQPPSSEQT